MLIASIGWLLVQGVRAVSKYSQNKLDISTADNREARSKLTQIRMFEAVIIAIIIIVFIAIALMTFETVRNLGKGILASAGVLGIIVGLAAQRSAGQLYPGAADGAAPLAVRRKRGDFTAYWRRYRRVIHQDGDRGRGQYSGRDGRHHRQLVKPSAMSGSALVSLVFCCVETLKLYPLT